MDLETYFSSDNDYDEFANEMPFGQYCPAGLLWSRFLQLLKYMLKNTLAGTIA